MDLNTSNISYIYPSLITNNLNDCELFAKTSPDLILVVLVEDPDITTKMECAKYLSTFDGARNKILLLPKHR